METRANYVAVGAFVLMVLGGIFVAVLWLASVQFHTEYKYYETHLAGSVTGLAPGAPVRLNGIEVGRVSGMEQDPKDPRLVRLILQVRNTVQIRADAVASLETTGFTGVSYIEIKGGSLRSPLLVAAKGEQYPTIASRPSSLQEVFNNAPELLARLLVISDRTASLLGDKNREALGGALANIRDITAVIERRSRDIDQLITDSGQTMHNLAAASTSLQSMSDKLDRTSDRVDRLVVGANGAIDEAGKAAADLDAAILSARPGLHELTGDDVDQLNALLSDARRLIASLTRVSTTLERDPSRFLFGSRREGYTPK